MRDERDRGSSEGRSDYGYGDVQKDNYFAKKGLDIMAEKMKKMAAKYPEIGKRIPTKVLFLPPAAVPCSVLAHIALNPSFDEKLESNMVYVLQFNVIMLQI